MAAYTSGQDIKQPSGNIVVRFCSSCGTKLDKGARFCKNCGKTVVQPIPSSRNSSTANHPQQETDFYEKTHKSSYQPYENPVADGSICERRSVFEGEIHKCPNCGETLASFVANCPACGFEFRGVKNSTSVREFAAKIEAIEKTRPTRRFGILSIYENELVINATDKKKVSLIRSFSIPNTKEDLFEFLVLASSNINMQRYNVYNQISRSEQAVSDAWEAKFEQAYEKAKLSFGNTPEFIKIQSIYKKKSTQITASKKKGKYILIGMISFLVLMMALLWGSLSGSVSADAKKIAKENTRLEAIVNEVYDAIQDEDYIMARAKAANLIFTGSTTNDGKQAAEKWDKTRTELLAIIDTAEGKTKADIPDDNSIAASGNEPLRADEHTSPNSVEIPADFVTGYEKAEFPKYNSFASENGLGGSKIYLVGVLERTEILEADGTRTILGFITDEEDNVWLVKMHAVPIVTETHFNAAVGKNVVCTVVYDGYSGKLQMPSTTLNELLVLEDGTVLFGLQKLLSD